MESMNRLLVYMLGGFEVYYGGMPLQFGKKPTAKPLLLLQLLLYHREDGVSREGVMEALFGDRDEIDAANNLNATVSQLRRLLRGTHLPEGNYIHIRLNRYYFDAAPLETWVDIEEATCLRHEADLATGRQRLSLLHSLCDLYRGRFLPGLDGENWVEIAKVEYQRLYRDSLTDLCRMLREHGDYDEIYRLTSLAAKLFPFDEWQVWQQEALLAQGKVQKAQELYLQVEKLYLEGLNSPPPEMMQHRYKKPEKKFWRRTESAESVRRWLAEEQAGDANLVPLPAFMCVYNLVRRMNNAENPFCLVICSLSRTDARYSADLGKLPDLMDALGDTLTHTLRIEDVFTRYSREQFLVLLTGTREENLSIILERIRSRFIPLATGTGFTPDFTPVSTEGLEAFSVNG